MAKAANSIRSKIRDAAKKVYIEPTEEICQKAEEELEKYITPEFVEKVRESLIKAVKQTPAPTGKNS